MTTIYTCLNMNSCNDAFDHVCTVSICIYPLDMQIFLDCAQIFPWWCRWRVGPAYGWLRVCDHGLASFA